MCGRFELITNFKKLPKVLKRDYPDGLESKYETQSLIRPTDPVLVIKNEGRIKTTFMSWGFISPWAKDPFDKDASCQQVVFLKKNIVLGRRIMRLFG